MSQNFDAAGLKVGDKIIKPVKGQVVKVFSDGKAVVVRDEQQKMRFVSIERVVKQQ